MIHVNRVYHGRVDWQENLWHQIKVLSVWIYAALIVAVGIGIVMDLSRRFI